MSRVSRRRLATSVSEAADAPRTLFDPLTAALGQLVRDRYAAEQAALEKVVALRPHQSKGRTVNPQGREQSA